MPGLTKRDDASASSSMGRWSLTSPPKIRRWDSPPRFRSRISTSGWRTVSIPDGRENGVLFRGANRFACGCMATARGLCRRRDLVGKKRSNHGRQTKPDCEIATDQAPKNEWPARRNPRASHRKVLTGPILHFVSSRDFSRVGGTLCRVVSKRKARNIPEVAPRRRRIFVHGILCAAT